MDFPPPSARIAGCLAGTAVAEAATIAGLAIAGLRPGDPDGRDSPAQATRVPLGPAGQLTLFTADALLEAIEWANGGVAADEAACLWLASLRWAAGQDVPLSPAAPVAQPRWLDTQEGVRVPAAIRPAWITSLADGEMGSLARPVGLAFDDAGAAAHAAPLGLVPHLPAAAVVKLVLAGAALTHGGSAARQAAVAVAATAHAMVLGADAATAAGAARAQVASLPSPDERILEAFDADTGQHLDAHDAAAALAGALAAVLAAESAAGSGDTRQDAFAGAVELAAVHGSDATAIAGALLGTLWGRDAVPAEWAERTAGIAAADGLAARLADATGT